MNKDFRATPGTPSLLADIDDKGNWLMVQASGDTLVIGAYDKENHRLELRLTAETLYGMVLDYNAPDPDAQRDDQKTEAALVTN